jgi:hypothetical protein
MTRPKSERLGRAPIMTGPLKYNPTHISHMEEQEIGLHYGMSASLQMSTDSPTANTWFFYQPAVKWFRHQLLSISLQVVVL